MMSGAYVTVGQFGAWTPIGAEQTANGLSGRLEEWRRRSVHRVEHRQQRQLALANAVMSGSSSTLKAFESTFHQDLNRTE